MNRHLHKTNEDHCNSDTHAHVHMHEQILQRDEEHTVNLDTLFGHNEQDGRSGCEEEDWDVKLSLEEGIPYTALSHTE